MNNCIDANPHEWGKWERTRIHCVDYIDGLFGKRAVEGFNFVQERICNKCNKTERSGFDSDDEPNTGDRR